MERHINVHEGLRGSYERKETKTPTPGSLRFEVRLRCTRVPMTKVLALKAPRAKTPREKRDSGLHPRSQAQGMTAVLGGATREQDPDALGSRSPGGAALRLEQGDAPARGWVQAEPDHAGPVLNSDAMWMEPGWQG